MRASPLASTLCKGYNITVFVVTIMQKLFIRILPIMPIIPMLLTSTHTNTNIEQKKFCMDKTQKSVDTDTTRWCQIYRILEQLCYLLLSFIRYNPNNASLPSNIFFLIQNTYPLICIANVKCECYLLKAYLILHKMDFI